MKFAVLMTFVCFTFGLEARTEGFADLVAKVQDSVVNIQTTVEVRDQGDMFRFFGQEPQERPGSGTGFIISEDGYIVTNRHVVADSTEVRVILRNEKEYDAKVIGSDTSMDVALIKIDAKGLTPFKLGDSSEMRIGDVVLAMGYPLQLGFSVTSGIVSGIGRRMQAGDFDVASYIQSDADITFGNSGGPLVNLKGEVIGMNTMIVSRGETFGFAIPSNLFRNSVEQLKEHGKVKRGALGIQVGVLSPEAKEYYGIENGALVASVTKGFPSEEAGVLASDVILKIDDKLIKDNNDVISYVSNKAPGEKVRMTLLSNGKEVTRTVVLGDRDKLLGRGGSDAPEEEVEESLDLGFSVRPLDNRVRRELGLDSETSGVVVTNVESGSLASRKGLRAGNIIVEAVGVNIDSVDDLKKALKKVKEKQVYPLKIIAFSRTRNGVQQVERTIFLRKN